jgi:hypothetical protein
VNSYFTLLIELSDLKTERINYMKKLLLCASMTLFLAACSVDSVKPMVVDGLKTVLTTKAKVTTAMVPNGDTSVTINGEQITVKQETFDTIRTLINTDSQLQQNVVDLVGSQITDENIAKIAYFVEKYQINPKDLLESLKG